MLSVILTILKILGIILLVIIGLLLTVTLIVLFVPIRYQSEGEFKKLEEGFKDNISIRVTWILRILSVSFKLTDKTPELVIKIFGKRLSFGQKKNKDGEKDKKDKKKNKKKKDKKKNNKTKDEKSKAKSEGDIAEDAKPKETNKKDNKKEDSDKIAAQTSLNDKSSINTETETATNSEEEPKKKGSIKAKLVGIKQKFIGICNKIVAICEKIKKVNDIKNAFIEYLQREDSKLAIRQIKTILFKALKKILPNKLKLRFKFGFEDPSTTGKILGMSSMFYGIYGENVEIEPDFDNVVLEGEYNLNGKIRLIHIVVAALKIYTNKWLKRFIKFSKKTLKS